MRNALISRQTAINAESRATARIVGVSG